MLTKKQIKEIREALDRSQNPLFYFHDDQDGLCSYILLRRYLGRGKGVPVKKIPMPEEYFRRVKEFNPDVIFALDLPDISKDFFDEVAKLNLPVVWIDHHDIDIKNPKFVKYYNPFLKNKKKYEPVSLFCQQIADNKQDEWISLVGCVSDKMIPKFYKDFLKKYPELSVKAKDAFDIYYKSELGKICKILGAGLKDRTTNVMKMIRFLIDAKGPYDVLNESKENASMHERFNEINSKFQKLIEKAKTEYDGGEILFFTYSADTGMTSELANYFSYLFEDKIIVIGHIKGEDVKFSIRGKEIREKILKILKKIENSHGGGHGGAVGVGMRLKDLDFFKKELKKIVEKSKMSYPEIRLPRQKR